MEDKLCCQIFMAENGVEENGLLPAEKKRLKTRSSSSSEDVVDRISKLSDELIVHILSVLPTVDAVSTSFLSDRWKRMWYLVPNLSFSITASRYNSSQDQEKFCNYIHNCLEHRKKAMFYNRSSVITSFKLQMDCYERTKNLYLDKWLTFAVEKKVKELNLCLSEEEEEVEGEVGFIYLYCIPKILALNAIHLTILELSMVMLHSGYSYNFPSLKSLSLTAVDFLDTSAVDELLLGSPSLEKLWLIDCGIHINDRRPYQLNIRSSSLKFLEIRLEKIHDLEFKKIEAINLESLELHGVSFDLLNLCVCKAITNLSLTCVWSMNESSSLEYLISNLPLLENLTLGNYKGVKLNRIKILSQNLKSFNVNNPFDGEMAVIIESAPKLESFSYRGNIKFSISIESSNLLSGTFIILNRPGNYDRDWFMDMLYFLLNLNHSWNRIRLVFDSVKALIVPENLKRICRSLLVDWEHLRVFTKCKPESEADLKDALLWIFPSIKKLSIIERRPCLNISQCDDYVEIYRDDTVVV